MGTSGKCVSAVGLCRDPGLGRRGCSPALCDLTHAGKGRASLPGTPRIVSGRAPQQSQLSPREGGAGVGVTRDFPAA